MELRSPLFLVLLLPVGLAAVAALLRRRPAVVFSSLGLHLGGRRGARARLAPLPPVFLLAAAALVVFALAGPRRGVEVVRRETEGIDIALCLDVSGSMQERDLDAERSRSRLDVAKEVVADFIRRRTEDNLALVIFAKRAYRITPLTPDKRLLAHYLAQVEVGIVDPDATAIGDALARAVDVLRASRAKSRVVILLTDGSNNAGQMPPLTAAEAARSLGVRVYTVGAGSDDPGLFRRYPIDEDLLRGIAARTGGRFFRAGDREGLFAAYREIDRLEKTRLEKVVYRRYREHFPALVAAALVCFLAFSLLEELLLRGVPA